MAEIYIVKLRVRFSAMLSLVLTFLAGLATWHFWNQIEFEPDNSKFLLWATITGALAMASVGLIIFYLIAHHIFTPSRALTAKMDAIPWSMLKLILVIAVVGITTFFVMRYRNLAEDEFGLLRKERLAVLETRIREMPGLLNRGNDEGLTLLQVAYLENHPDAVRLLVDLGAPIADLNYLGITPVIASMMNFPMLGTLLDCGLDPSVSDADGIPAVHHAIRKPTPKALELLIEAGVNLDARDGIYRTALMQCIEADNYPMAEILIEHGADLDAFDQRGDTALHIAVRRRREEGIKFLLEYNADTTVFNFIHMTPLHIAAQVGQDNLVKLLADDMEDVDLIDETDRTPFEIALTSRKYETATLLIEYDADIDRVLADGKTLLHLSIDRKEYAIARFLLRAGARSDIPDKQGQTALDICREKELQGLVEMIEGLPQSSDE